MPFTVNFVAQLSQLRAERIDRLIDHCKDVWSVYITWYEWWPGLISVGSPYDISGHGL